MCRPRPGVVAMATDRQRNIHEGAAGKCRLDRDADMTTDTVFAIFSTTKAITGTAALQLVEEGKQAAMRALIQRHVAGSIRRRDLVHYPACIDRRQLQPGSQDLRSLAKYLDRICRIIENNPKTEWWTRRNGAKSRDCYVVSDWNETLETGAHV